jgi:choline-sulfatase
VTATVLDLAGVGPDPDARLDGDSLLPGLRGEVPWPDCAFSEYTAHGNDRPRAMVKRGAWKLGYGYVPDGPPQLELYDHRTDPGEFANLADRPEHHAVQAQLLAELLAHWDPAEIHEKVTRSQRERMLIASAGGRDTF